MSVIFPHSDVFAFIVIIITHLTLDVNTFLFIFFIFELKCKK